MTDTYTTNETYVTVSPLDTVRYPYKVLTFIETYGGVKLNVRQPIFGR